jgi:flagellar basal body-associated protein FliL
MAVSTRVGAWPATSRLTTVIAILLVFLTGAIAGAVAMNFSAHKRLHRSVPFWTEGGKEVWLQRWKKELNLTPEQSQEMVTILDDFGTYYRNVLSDGKARILRILNEDQRRKFDKLLQEQQR